MIVVLDPAAIDGAWALTVAAHQSWDRHMQQHRMAADRQIGQNPVGVIAKPAGNPQPGQCGSACRTRHHRCVRSCPPTAAPVIVTPNSTVRQMVSATRHVGSDIGSCGREMGV